MNRPNVILIIADQFRRDCLGVAGHPDVKTPFLDTLASEGILFPNAWSATPSCIPARAALHTGLSQEHHGRVGYADGVPWDYENTLASAFSAAGYQCHCAGKMHVHPLRSSLGYHSIDLHDGYLGYYRQPDTPYCEDQRIVDDYFHEMQGLLNPDGGPADTGLDVNGWAARPWPYAERLHPTRWATDRAIDFLRKRDRSKPFFLTLSYVRPHPPLDAPDAFFTMYRGKPLRPPLAGDWADHERVTEMGRIMASDTGPSDPELIRMAQEGYYANITQIDYEYGRLRSILHSNGLNKNNTIVMFISDHGEMLSDHGLFRKCLPYNGSAGIPFIISASEELLRRASGEKYDISSIQNRLVEIRDVMPTLLSLCGIDPPAGIDGCSVFAANWQRSYLHGEHTISDGSCQWVVTKKDKFIWFSRDGHRQYFDLEKDPDELHNAIDDAVCGPRIAFLENILTQELCSREEGFVKNGRLIPGAAVYPVLKQT